MNPLYFQKDHHENIMYTGAQVHKWWTCWSVARATWGDAEWWMMWWVESYRRRREIEKEELIKQYWTWLSTQGSLAVPRSLAHSQELFPLVPSRFHHQVFLANVHTITRLYTFPSALVDVRNQQIQLFRAVWSFWQSIQKLLILCEKFGTSP